MRHFPSFRYHEQLGEAIVKNEAQHEKLESEGWVESPADFASAKSAVKAEDPLEKVKRELAELESVEDGEPTKEVPAGTPMTVDEMKSALLNHGFSKKELKGMSEEELVEALKQIEA